MDFQLHERENWMAMVWLVADPSAAAQMYLSRNAAALRVAAKNDDEDVAISAHLVIDFGVPSGAMRYPAALEDHETVSRLRIQSLFQKLLKQYLPSVTAEVAEGVGKTGEPKLIMDAHPGRKITGTDLKPFEIELIKQTPRQQMTASHVDPFVQSVERRLFKLVHDGTAAQLRAGAVSYATKLRGLFPEHRIRIRWRDPDNRADAGATTIVEPGERPERLLERALTRTEHLEGFRGLPEATPTVISRLAQRMLESLRAMAVEDRGRR